MHHYQLQSLFLLLSPIEQPVQGMIVERIGRGGGEREGGIKGGRMGEREREIDERETFVKGTKMQV